LTLLEVLKRAAGYLQTHGSASPRLDAELLMAHALGLRRLDLFLQFERPLAESELGPYRELIARRAKGEPVAYLIGHKEFMKLDFEVDPAVLVPNPDTELLVERAVSWARARGGELRVADVGTGSGCIAVALAHYVPSARVWASDVDGDALAVASRNVAAHSLTERVALCQGDLLDPLPERLDLICANLPYVAENAEPALSADVRAQPRVALFAGEGGAALVRRLLATAPSHLAPAGALFAEIGPGLEEAFDLAAYAGHRVHTDLAGLPRVIEAWL
jgi:release factor glutamine methyltransferase